MSCNYNILDIKEILKILPHRYPLLLIDKVLDFKVYNYLKALKNCTINEPFFQGHFFKEPIFPGVLLIEVMTQAAAILIYKSVGILNINKVYYFFGIENVRFKKNIIPGDQIFIEVVYLNKKRNITKFKVVAVVNNTNVCHAVILFYKQNNIE